MSNYPTSLDDNTSLPNPTTSSYQDTVSHAAQHANANTSIKALEAKLGIGSTVPSSTGLFLLPTGPGTTAWSQITSSQLAATLTDETGSGSAVFANTPTLITPKVDTINENTSANGVTVGGVNLKNGKLNTANAVISSNITNASVTADKINLGAQTATIAADQTTTSISFADLATVGPSVTVTIGANGMALVFLVGGLYNNSVPKFMGYAVSGATTIVASATNALRNDSLTATVYGGTFLQTGLNPGSNTFTVKYSTNSGTANFFNRQIVVVPL